VTVTATDSTGATASTTFNETVNAVATGGCTGAGQLGHRAGDAGDLHEPERQHGLRAAELLAGGYAGKTVTLEFSGTNDHIRRFRHSGFCEGSPLPPQKASACSSTQLRNSRAL
jgi:hypothetical protein